MTRQDFSGIHGSMTRPVQYSDKQIAEALEKAGGMITYAASLLHADYHWLSKRVKENPILLEAQKNAKEMTKDLAEYSLIQLIKGVQVQGKKGVVYKVPPELGAIAFYLKCQAKDRGYVERQEITGADGAPLTIVFEDADSAQD